MTDDQLYSYSGSYENYINRGLDGKKDQQARDFQDLLRLEQSLSSDHTLINKLLSASKNLLIDAFMKLSRSAEFKAYKDSFIGWIGEIERASFGTDIGLICLRADKILFPETKNETL